MVYTVKSIAVFVPLQHKPQCEECSKLNSFSFNFWKGTIQIKHFYGDIVKEAISEDNELSKLY